MSTGSISISLKPKSGTILRLSDGDLSLIDRSWMAYESTWSDLDPSMVDNRAYVLSLPQNALLSHF